MGSLSMFMNLPMPVKAAIFVATGGGLVGLMFLLTTTGAIGNAFGYLLLTAMVVAGAVFGIYKLISKRMEKRKAKPFEQKMADSASATPSGVSDPGSRAQLDDLRKRFEEGISVFKEHGKDLYTMPWYVIVGEPGSGKTEAMRHSNVGFPPGLQDQLQGVGGTVNMHWWFTNHAVMIDTAGRLMFEDIEPGNVSEWGEFLKMLRTARPNCPLNGMLLVIPADSLIKDSANDIERKGGKIAQQLDNIQRALGVRFPVYIVISKADRINGFREFFEDLTDPVTQMQMMGWTNPNDLDTPFDPSLVEQHLKNVRERLVRRRFALLTDPVNSDDPMGRRIDQVDALYAFPDSLVKLAPRLRRYLEMVFVAGEWSQKPLFLRGIYFTSSMREGDALDADLAEVLGVQVDALREGKLWERDRSYFLKDVFMEKVFREKGLVTRESNVGKSRRRQSTILIAAGLLLALGAGLWTWYASSRLEESISVPSRDWTAIAGLVEKDESGEAEDRRGDPAAALVQPYSGRYMGMHPTDADLTRMGAQRTAYNSANNGLRTDPIFWFAAATTGSMSTRMREAQRILFDRYALLPFVDEARRRMGAPTINPENDPDWRTRLARAGKGEPPAQEWSQHAVDALVVLLEIQAVGLDVNKEYTPEVYERWIERLGDYPFLNDAVARRFRGTEDTERQGWDDFTAEDRKFLADVMYERFGADGAGVGGHAGVVESLAADEPYAIGAALAGVNSFVAEWEAGGASETSLLGLLDVFAASGGEYRRIEGRVLSFTGFGEATTSDEFEAARTAWLDEVARLREKKAELDAILARPVVYDPDSPDETKPLLEVLGTGSPDQIKSLAMSLATSEVETTFRRLLSVIPAGIEPANEREEALAQMRSDLTERQVGYTAELTTSVQDAMIALAGGSRGGGLIEELAWTDSASQSPSYAVRFETIDRTASQIQKAQSLRAGVVDFGASVATLESEVRATRLPNTDDAGLRPLLRDTATVCGAALAGYQAYHTSALVRKTIDDLADPAKEIGSLVSNRSLAAADGERAPDFDVEGVPWLDAQNARLERQFDEIVAEGVLGSIDELSSIVTGDTSLLDAEEIKRSWTAVDTKLLNYRDAYIEYWTESVPDIFTPVIRKGDSGAWKAAHDALWNLNEEIVLDALIAVTDRSLRALRMFKDEADSSAGPYVEQLNEDRLGLARGGSDASTLRMDASAMRGGWRNLSDDLETAYSRLDAKLRRDPFVEQAFKSEFFAVFTGKPMTPARSYWSGVAEVMLAAMNNSLRGEEASKRRALLSIGARFPLAVDGDRPLSAAEYADARAVIEWLSSRVVASSDPQMRPTLINGLPTRAADELRDLQSGATVEPAQVELIQDLGATIKAIDATGSLKIKLGSPEANSAFVENYKFVRVMQGGEPLAIGGQGLAQAVFWTDRAADTEGDLITLKLPETGANVELWFWATQADYEAEQGQNPIEVGVLPMPWHGLLGVASSPNPAEGVLVPLVMRQGSGQYFMRVTGLEQIPASWPTVEDWERAGN